MESHHIEITKATRDLCLGFATLEFKYVMQKSIPLEIQFITLKVYFKNPLPQKTSLGIEHSVKEQLKANLQLLWNTSQ